MQVIESFNGEVRDECFNSLAFTTIAEAQSVLDAWREDDNAVRTRVAICIWLPIESQDRSDSGNGLNAKIFHSSIESLFSVPAGLARAVSAAIDLGHAAFPHD